LLFPVGFGGLSIDVVSDLLAKVLFHPIGSDIANALAPWYMKKTNAKV